MPRCVAQSGFKIKIKSRIADNADSDNASRGSFKAFVQTLSQGAVLWV